MTVEIILDTKSPTSSLLLAMTNFFVFHFWILINLDTKSATSGSLLAMTNFYVYLIFISGFFYKCALLGQLIMQTLYHVVDSCTDYVRPGQKNF